MISCKGHILSQQQHQQWQNKHTLKKCTMILCLHDLTLFVACVLFSSRSASPHLLLSVQLPLSSRFVSLPPKCFQKKRNRDNWPSSRAGVVFAEVSLSRTKLAMQLNIGFSECCCLLVQSVYWCTWMMFSYFVLSDPHSCLLLLENASADVGNRLSAPRLLQIQQLTVIESILWGLLFLLWICCL